MCVVEGWFVWGSHLFPKCNFTGQMGVKPCWLWVVFAGFWPVTSWTLGVTSYFFVARLDGGEYVSCCEEGWVWWNRRW